MRIVASYPIHIKAAGPGYAAHAIIESMIDSGADATLFCYTTELSLKSKFHRYVLPPRLKSLGYRLLSQETIRKIMEKRFIGALEKKDIAYLWPGSSVELFRKVKQRGNIIVTEKINTHLATSKPILDVEYSRLGIPVGHKQDFAGIAVENSKFELADYLYSPSEQVTGSLVKAGVPSNKIISCSYGLATSDIFSDDLIAKRKKKEITAVFMGRIGIRKGVLLLLDYWVKAGVQGILKLVGAIEPNVRQLVAPYLERPDIQHVGYCQDLKPVLQEADVFMLPSLEEGSPLVTYLAMGAGLPSLVSPMGGGSIVRDGQDGIIMDPYDSDAWVEAIRKVFADPKLRKDFGSNAHERSYYYTWPLVGQRRWEALRDRLTGRVGHHNSQVQ